MKIAIKKFINFLDRKFRLNCCVIYSRNFDYAKTKKNHENWFKEIENCPFCVDYKKSLIKEFNTCYLLKNIHPYENTQDHLLIVTKRHIREWKQLQAQELEEIKNIISEYLDKGYLLLWRQFIKNWTASVYHLHIHLILNKSYD